MDDATLIDLLEAARRVWFDPAEHETPKLCEACAVMNSLPDIVAALRARTPPQPAAEGAP